MEGAAVVVEGVEAGGVGGGKVDPLPVAAVEVLDCISCERRT